MRWNRPQRLLFIGALGLTLGLLMPWVTLEPAAVQQKNLGHVADFVSSPRLPRAVRDWLGDHGLKPNMTAEEVWVAVSSGPHEDDFTRLQKHRQLYLWDMLALGTHWFAKITFILVAGLWLASWIVWARRQRSLDHDPYAVDPLDALDVDDYYMLARPRKNLGTLALAGLVALLLFVWQIPHLDSLGHLGDWSTSLLDVISGARAAFAPRVLVPLGLLCITLSGAGDAINQRTQYADPWAEETQW